MKTERKNRVPLLAAAFLLLLLSLSLFSCGRSDYTVIPGAYEPEEEPTGENKADGITLNLHETTIPVGDSTLLVAVVTPLDAPDRKVTWSTGDASIATVDEKGRIVGVSRGKTVITATAAEGSVRADCTVTVKSSQNYNNDGTVKVQGVNISRTSMSMSVGGTVQLSASVYPDDAVNQKITFLNSNTRVVNLEVTGNGGKVTAVGPGRAVITAISEDGQKTASCEIQVLAYLTGMRLSAEYLSLAPGQSSTITVIPEPENATNTAFVWSCSNSRIASVNANGKVTAIANGTAVITARSADGKYSAKCALTVEPRSDFVPMSNFEISQKEITVAAGEDARVLITLIPENTTETELTYRSSNSMIAQVDPYGIVTGMREGETTVTVTGKGGAISRSVKITVLKNTVSHRIYLSEIDGKLSMGGSVKLDSGVTGRLEPGEKVVWMSTNPSVAKVDENGTVTGLSIGSADIVAALSVCGNAARRTVTVANNGVKSVSLNVTSLELAAGKTYTLKATLQPADASVTAVNWFSSDTSVATVNRKGVVTAVGSGRAEITVRTVDSKREAVCVVTVPNTKITSVKLSNHTLEMPKGDARALYFSVEPKGASSGGMKWTSSDTKVVTVDAEGLVTAVGDGTATVTISSANGVKDSCKITVRTVPVERVSLDKGSLTLSVGGSAVIKASVYPLDAGDRRVKYVSSNPSVVKVDDQGNVTAVGKGMAIVTVSSVADPKKSRVCAVEVN